MKTLFSVLKVIRELFVIYSIIFSIVGTTAAVYVSYMVLSPIKKVKRLEKSNPDMTLYMKNVKNELESLDSSQAILQIFVPIDSISPSLIQCVLAAEDDGFYVHPGIDIAAILNALDHNRLNRRRIHGASTITQQVAKNIFVGGEKSYKRKFHEIFYTILLEWLLGKDRILEIYLNYAQWGKNIFGCEAASQYYFKKSSKDLSIYQSARLAATLAMPSKLNPNYTKSAFLQKRLVVIANNLFLKRVIDDSTFAALAGPEALPPETNGKNGGIKDNEQAEDTLNNQKYLTF